MKVIIELPRDWEVNSVNMEKGKITIEPRFTQGQKTTAPLAHITSVGNGGREVKTVISVSGATGGLNMQRMVEREQEVLFDLTPEEYEKRKAPPQEAERAAPKAPPVPPPTVPPGTNA